MNEQLISFKTAKLAKETGFDAHAEIHSSDKCYTPDGVFYEDHIFFSKTKRCKKRGFLCCSQSVLQKWLREKHDTHIVVNPIHYDFTKYYADVHGDYTGDFKTYEEALEEGLQKALRILIESL